jgi:dTDP-4-dehydrorhamnose reductase
MTAEVAAACARFGSYLLLISSDFVYPAAPHARREVERPAPRQWYGWTKQAAEMAATKITECGVLRLSKLFGRSVEPGRHNWPGHVADALLNRRTLELDSAIVRYPVLVTDAADLAGRMVIDRHSGIVHLGGTEGTTMFDWGTMIARQLHADARLLQQVTTSTLALRPANVRLDSTLARRMWRVEATSLAEATLVSLRALGDVNTGAHHRL